MNPFLYNVAKTYYDNIVKKNDNNIRFSDIAFIFPNKRSGLFFKKALKEIADRNIFLPRIFDINSFVLNNVHKVIASDIELLLTLYEAYREIKGEANKIEELNKFTNLGFSLIKDFDEIDKYLIDTDVFFNNIEDLQNLKKTDYLSEEQKQAIKAFFNFDTDKEINRNYFSLWKILNQLYINYKSKLDQSGKAYYGMLFREYTEQLKNPAFTNPALNEFKRIVFVGFNFLTKSEEEIFKYYNNNKIGDFYFDYPEIYKDKNYFQTTIAVNYEKNLRQFKSKYNFEQEKEIRFPRIDILKTSTNSGQIHIANQILSDTRQDKESDLSDTALLLPDESMLTSLLEYIPIDISKLNVTMGYPLNISLLSGLIDDITSLQLNAKKDDTSGTVYYNYKEVMSIISNQYVKQNAFEICNNLTSNILKNNLIWISKERILEFINKFEENTLISKLFLLNDTLDKVATTAEFSDYISDIIDILLSQYSRLDNPSEEDDSSLSDVTAQSQNENINTHFLIQYKQYLNQLNSYIANYMTEIDLKTFYSFLSHLTANLKIQLYGEPLKGLQIMGMLESRLIDFKNIIIVGFNDENLPGITTSSTSVIPYILRKAYGLPTYEQHNAIYAYNFFRTIYRAEKISCIYNSEKAISQYYYIFKFIFPQIDGNFEIQNYSEKNTTVANNINSGAMNEEDNIIIKKEGNISNKLSQYSADSKSNYRLSPSALKIFISCPLKFYFSYILKLKETDEISEIIDSADFGLVFHKVMELYYIGNKTREIKEICKEEFLKTIQATTEEGKQLYNKLILSLLYNFTESTLKYDDSRQFTFAAAEKEILFTIGNINFRGIIDRIDIDHETKTINIIDYKTSRPGKQAGVTFENLFSYNTAGMEALQILMYCKAISESKEFCNELGVSDPENYKIRPMIYKIYDIYNDDSKGKKIREQNLAVSVTEKTFDNLEEIFPEENITDETKRDYFHTEEKVDSETDFIVTDYKTWKYRYAFEYYLSKITDRLMTDKTFEPYDKTRRDCSYCPYLHICRKESEVTTF